MVVDSQGRRGISLGVEINNQHFCAKAGKSSSDVYSRRGLSHATLLV